MIFLGCHTWKVPGEQAGDWVWKMVSPNSNGSVVDPATEPGAASERGICSVTVRNHVWGFCGFDFGWGQTLYMYIYIYVNIYIYIHIHTSFHLSKFQMFWIATGEHNLVHNLVGILPSAAILATSAIWRSQSWFTSGFEGYTPPKRHVLLVILGFVPLDTGCTSDFSWSLPLYGVRFTSLSGRLWTVAPWIITPSN